MNKWKMRLYGLIIIHLIWYLLSLQLGENLIPRPDVVWMYLGSMIFDGTIFMHAGYSIFRIFSAMGIALIIGVPIGLLTGVSKKIDKWFSPIVYLLFPIPKIAFLPVFIALFGLGDLSKIILLFTVLIFQVILSARDSVKQIPIEFHQIVKIMKLSKKEKLLKLYLPSALPNLLSSLRVGIGISLAVLFFGENYATTYGMGYYIMNNWMMVNYVGMFAGILALSIIAAGLLFIIDLVERHFCKWISFQERNVI